MKKYTLAALTICGMLLFVSPENSIECESHEVTVSENIGTPYVVSINTIERPIFFGYYEEEVDLMAAVVYLEAGNQDELGKQLVVDSILNRVDCLYFPNTVIEVIDQRGQYHTAKRAHKMNPNDIPIDCYGAVVSEIAERKNTEVIYFSRGYGCGEPLFKHGAHCFSGLSKRLKEKSNEQ